MTPAPQPQLPGLSRCANCNATLIAPDDGQPRWCTICSYEEELRSQQTKEEMMRTKEREQG